MWIVGLCLFVGVISFSFNFVILGDFLALILNIIIKMCWRIGEWFLWSIFKPLSIVFSFYRFTLIVIYRLRLLGPYLDWIYQYFNYCLLIDWITVFRINRSNFLWFMYFMFISVVDARICNSLPLVNFCGWGLIKKLINIFYILFK